jgi:TPR repeat protein
MENDKTTSAVPTKEELQAFIQAHSYYYIPKWESFDSTLKRVAPGTFNWAACLLNVFWMAYRRMYLFVIILVAFEAVCFSILEFFFRLPTSVTNSVGIATMILLGRYGNSIYRKHVERKIRQIKTKIAPEYQSQAFRDSGGTSLWAPIPLIILQLLTLFGMFYGTYQGILQKNVKANVVVNDANTSIVTPTAGYTHPNSAAMTQMPSQPTVQAPSINTQETPPQIQATTTEVLAKTTAAGGVPTNDWKLNDSYLQKYHADHSYDPRTDSEILSEAKVTGKLDAFAAESAADQKSLDDILDQMWGSSAVKNFTDAKAKAEAGDAKAQKTLGDCYKLVIGVSRNDVEAAKWYRKAAEQGDAPAQFCLGVCYDNGTGVAQDYAEAIKWYQKSLNQGYAEAQASLTNLETAVQKIQSLKTQAETGDAEAQFSLGSLYETRWRATTNDVFNSISPTNATLLEAMAWYRKAAEQGNAKAQLALGICYWSAGIFLGTDDKPDLTNKNKIEAVKWYRKAAEQGNAKAQLALGDCYQNGDGVSNVVTSFEQAMSQQWNGDGVSKDMVEAVKWYSKAAEQGSIEAEWNLGENFFAGMDYVQAYKWFCIAASHARSDLPEGFETPEQIENNYAKMGESSLISLLQLGRLTQEEIEEAKQLVSKEAPDAVAKVEADLAAEKRRDFEAVKLKAENGNPWDQEVLASDYEQGKGVATNLVEAVRWYRNAADQGYAEAQCDLGYCYANGTGIETNYVEAVKWYRMAANQGNANAQSQLGYCYQDGQGVPKDFDEAYKWFNLASAQPGHSYDMAGTTFLMGAACYSGDGVPLDYVQAYKWYNLASALGNKSAAACRDALAALMTPDQIAEAQKLSSEFQPHTESASTNSN